ncbi:MAG: helix-turn-helix domain-containing protein [Phaeodactylibacter sp.]|nr:helix-turn-helix domain-containing protein [Phaeodactylibacter sp.]
MKNKGQRPKTRQEIANELGISYTTFWRWLKNNNIELPRGLVYPNKQKEIFQKIFSDFSKEKEE